jgi:hypothetical protein
LDSGAASSGSQTIITTKSRKTRRVNISSFTTIQSTAPYCKVEQGNTTHNACMFAASADELKNLGTFTGSHFMITVAITERKTWNV